jgi:hypothetical protein
VNGLFNAQKLMEDTSTGLHFIAQAATTAAAPYTFSCYAKAAGRNFVFLYNPATNISLSVDLTTGATGQASGTVAPTSSSAVNVGNGWYRVSMTLTTTAASNNFRVYLGQSLTGTGSYTGDGNSGVYIYGAMLSNSASLDPYVPTPGAAPSSAAYYGPRFDYDPVTLLPRGLLVEEARTNLATYSEQFDNAAWVKGSSTVTANATTAPDGTLTADKLQVANTSSAQKNVSQTVGAISTTYADTVYAKASELSWLIINQYDGADRRTWFNLSNGTVGTTAAGTTASIQALPNGWYRCSAVRTMGTGAIQLVLNVADADNSAVFVGTVGQGIFIWGAQREAGAFATSYIPTIASTVTRSADVATITGSLFSQWYNGVEGSFIVEANTAFVGNFPVVIGNSASNTSSFLYVTSGGKIGTWNGTTALDAVAGATTTNNTVFKAANAYASPGRNLSMNGAAVVSDANSVGSISLIALGKPGVNTTQMLNGHIRSIRYVPVRAADFQLQQVTT